MSRTLYVRTIAAVLGGLTAATLAACSDSSTADGVPPTFQTVTATTNVLPVTTTTEEIPVAPKTNEAAEAELPYEVTVYVSMAKDLVANGTIPASAVTPLAVKADVSREYGIDLTEAQAERAVAEILGYAR